MSTAQRDRSHPGSRRAAHPSAAWVQRPAWALATLLALAVLLTPGCSRQKADEQASQTEAKAPASTPSAAEIQALTAQLSGGSARRHPPRHYPRKSNSDATTAELVTLAADYSQARDPAARQALMDKLAAYCDPAAIPIVMSALADSSAEVRAAALEALAGYTTGDVVAPALKGLQDSDVAVRRAAMEALSCVEDAAAAEAIALAFTDADAEVREAAFDCLQEVPYEAQITLLEEALKAPAGDVRQAAVSELEDLSNHDAVHLLIEALKDREAEVRQDAADALWFLVSERFTDAETARRWWDANRKRFDEDLFEKD